jgi:lipopolysaccharide export system protein LptC
MRISQTSILLIASLLTGLAIFLFSESGDDQAAPASNETNSNKPNAFIENAVFKLYDEEGFATELHSSKALFYSESAYIDIFLPEITLTNASGSEIYLSAKTGRFHPQLEELSLNGDVSIAQLSPASESWSIEGQQFQLNNKTRFISSSQAVTINQNKSTLRAIGLEAWISEKRIELLSNVRGQYVFNQ